MLSDFFAFISEIIIPVVLVILLIVCLGGVIWLGASFVDQLTATQQLVQNVEVVDKTATTYILPQYVGNQPIMIPHQAYKLTFRVGKTEMTADVNFECYRNANKGDRMDIYIRKGMISTGVYPICK